MQSPATPRSPAPARSPLLTALADRRGAIQTLACLGLGLHLSTGLANFEATDCGLEWALHID
jgi:hypothetical protein